MSTRTLFARMCICLIATVVLGCAANAPERRATSSYQIIVPSTSERYEESPNQKFLLGDRIGAALLPEYPQPALAKHLPVQIVCIEIDIDADGHVSDSRPLYGVAGCPSDTLSPSEMFLASAKLAVKQWVFMPARMCTFPPNAQTNDSCASDDVTVEYVPVRLAFMFYFSIEEGRARVTTHEVGGKVRQ